MTINVDITEVVDDYGYELCDYLGRFTDQPKSAIYFDRKDNLLLMDDWDDYEYVVDDPDQQLDEDELLEKYAPNCIAYSDENFYGRLGGQDAYWEDGKWYLTFSGPRILARWVTRTTYEGRRSYRYIDNKDNWDDEDYELEYIIQDIKRLEGYNWNDWYYVYYKVQLTVEGAFFTELSVSVESDCDDMYKREVIQEAIDNVTKQYQRFISSSPISGDMLKSLFDEELEEVI